MKIALKISLVIANLLLIVMGLSFDLFHDNFSGVMRGYFLGLLPCVLILALAFFHAFKGEGIVMFIMGEIMVFVPYIHVLFAYLGVFFMTLSLVIRIEKYRFSDFLLIKKAYGIMGMVALAIFINIMFFMMINALSEIIYYMGMSIELWLFLNYRESAKIRRD